jgi:GAF domain-containing protein
MDGFVKNTCGAALDRAGDFAAVDAEPRLLGSDTHGDLGIVPGISTVIEGRSGPFGVIAVRGTDRNRDFPEEDRIFFETVAGVLSVAVQQHDLGTRLERQDRLISVIAEQDSSHGETKLNDVLAASAGAGSIPYSTMI